MPINRGQIFSYGMSPPYDPPTKEALLNILCHLINTQLSSIFYIIELFFSPMMQASYIKRMH